MPNEVTVKVKSADRTMKHKSLVYEAVTASHSDPIIRELVKEAQKTFGQEPHEIEDITVTIKLGDE